MENNDIFEIINMEGQDISPAVHHMLQSSQPTLAFCRKKLFHIEKTVGQGPKF